jgi:arsenate-mycothiol transferase
MTTPHATRPSELFVCEKNRGKPQMAAGLMRKIPGDTTHPRLRRHQAPGQINGLYAQTLLEVGVDITHQTPKQLTDDLIRRGDLVVALGRDQRRPVDGTPVEVWDTDEPSKHGIDGIELMRLVRDESTAASNNSRLGCESSR